GIRLKSILVLTWQSVHHTRPFSASFRGEAHLGFGLKFFGVLYSASTKLCMKYALTNGGGPSPMPAIGGAPSGRASGRALGSTVGLGDLLSVSPLLTISMFWLHP